jgi:hypothetical protein
MDQAIEDLLGKSKKALEDYGRDIGIELDRRKTKDHLITQLEEHIMAKKSKKKAKSGLGKIAEAVAGTVKEVTEVATNGEKVLLRDKNTGQFYTGKKPKGTKSGSKGGIPFWEV